MASAYNRPTCQNCSRDYSLTCNILGLQQTNLSLLLVEGLQLVRWPRIATFLAYNRPTFLIDEGPAASKVTNTGNIANILGLQQTLSELDTQTPKGPAICKMTWAQQSTVTDTTSLIYYAFNSHSLITTCDRSCHIHGLQSQFSQLITGSFYNSCPPVKKYLLSYNRHPARHYRRPT